MKGSVANYYDCRALKRWGYTSIYRWVITMPEEWTEVNLVLNSVNDRIRALLDTIEPMVHNELNGRIDTWFFGHYGTPPPYHLRVRILWRNQEDVSSGKDDLSTYLDNRKSNGSIADWYEGRDGERGQRYLGEDDRFGAEMWEVTYKLWGCQSEFALTLLKNESERSLSTQPFVWHWERALHLFTNRLFLGIGDEIYLTLRQAGGYLNYFAQDNNFDAQMRASFGTLAQAVNDVEVSVGTGRTRALLDGKTLQDFDSRFNP